MRVVRTVLFLGLLCSGVLPSKAEPPYAVPMAIPEANPRIRKEQTFEVPTKLRVGEMKGQASYGLAPKPLEKINLKVGSLMATGAEYKVYIYPLGEARPENGEVGTGLCDIDALSAWTGYRSGKTFGIRGRKYVLEVVISIFETDVPSGHGWDPYSKKYKVLWTRTLQETVD